MREKALFLLMSVLASRLCRGWGPRLCFHEAVLGTVIEPVPLASQTSRHVDQAPTRHVFVRFSLMSW